MDDTDSGLQMNKFVGCLIGMAVADAVGSSNEFGSQLTGKGAITGMTGGGPFRLKPGEWTDDTSMALCLAVSLLVKGKYDQTDVMARYLSWWKSGYLSSNGRCFDIGNTTSRALSYFASTGKTLDGISSPANGSIMRLAPVPMFYANDPRLAEIMSAESSRATHTNAACVQGCAFLGGLIARLLNGNRHKTEIVSAMTSNRYWAVGAVANSKEEEAHLNNLLAVADGGFNSVSEADLSQAGSVWATLNAALYTFINAPDFASGALQIANRGNDSDTVGAVYGMIAGAYYGIAGIPAGWTAKLARKDDIKMLAQHLFLYQHGEGGKLSKDLIEAMR